MTRFSGSVSASKVKNTRGFRSQTGLLCDCGSGLYVLSHSRMCESCERYNAAVKAQQAVADHFAVTRIQRPALPIRAHLNAFGSFAVNSDGVMIQTASIEEVAPFVGLTYMARKAGAL